MLFAGVCAVIPALPAKHVHVFHPYTTIFTRFCTTPLFVFVVCEYYSNPPYSSYHKAP